MNESVVQEWVSSCSWKQQTVLLSSFRGCDGLPKHDASKLFTKKMRVSILKNADASSTFMPDHDFALSKENREPIDDFFIDCSRGSMDQYPVHWFLHFLQAAEIVAYKCPYEDVAHYWMYFYAKGVSAMHLTPETETQLDERLEDKPGKSE